MRISDWSSDVCSSDLDAGHVFIHKSSILLDGNDIALPLGFAPGDADQLTRSEITPGAPIGVFDLLGEHSVPVFDGVVEGETAVRGHFGEKTVARSIRAEERRLGKGGVSKCGYRWA